jgi:hypothetical protein
MRTWWSIKSIDRACHSYNLGYYFRKVFLKKIKQLVPVLQEFNGLVARTKKDPSEENRKMLDECLVRLKQRVDEVLD